MTSYTVRSTTRLSGDISMVRTLNLRSVLRVLYDGGSHTITSIAAVAGISRPTTSQAISDLLAAGWIQPSGQSADRQDGPGRPAQRFEFRPRAGHVLGVDIGGHKVLVLVSDLSGEIVAERRATLRPASPRARRLAVMNQAINEALNAAGLPASGISCAAIATPGVVGPDGKVAHAPAIPEWVGVDLGEHVQDRFGIPTQVFNDMRMAALAEHWKGVARDASDVVYVHVGRRMGTGLLVAGRPHAGRHGAAAEIGLWRGLPWAHAYERLLELAPGALTKRGDAIQAIFDAAKAGDAAAQAGIDAFADLLVQGLAPVMVTIDPELVIIGGGISAAGEAIREPVRTRIERETDFPPKVVCSIMGDHSSAIGAVRSALDVAEERLFAELKPGPGASAELPGQPPKTVAGS
ncbi:ROK family transcriptional regulator [Nonomuraea sp. NPDC005650]|uniref:ROK family transcriptional regulator n=1 Tax=Nonomuraea sp. NPDC005650 TaxID=3157045 RepID=UPI0033A9BDE2